MAFDNVDSDKQKEADFIMVLSSEMISDVIERYLNNEMFKQQVKVVDTKPTESGYAFGITFVHEQAAHMQFSNEWKDSHSVETSVVNNNKKVKVTK